jgi:hypothetical protein
LTALGVVMVAASGLHDGISSLRFHFDPRYGKGGPSGKHLGVQGTPTPGVFAKEFGFA